MRLSAILLSYVIKTSRVQPEPRVYVQLYRMACVLADAELYVQRAERIAEVFEELISNEINFRLTYSDCWTALEAARI